MGGGLRDEALQVRQGCGRGYSLQVDGVSGRSDGEARPLSVRISKLCRAWCRDCSGCCRLSRECAEKSERVCLFGRAVSGVAFCAAEALREAAVHSPPVPKGFPRVRREFHPPFGPLGSPALAEARALVMEVPPGPAAISAPMRLGSELCPGEGGAALP